MEIFMSVIFAVMIAVSYIFGLINGNVGDVTSAMFDGARGGVNVVLSFAGVMCFWTGIIKAAQMCGVSRLFEALLRPVTRMLFPGLSDGRAREYITLNMSANILGMGNAATPMGVKAMRELDGGGGATTDDMCMFTVLNTASFQLIPSTVIALRSGAGSAQPFSVLIPIWCTSLCALTVGIICVRLTGKWRS